MSQYLSWIDPRLVHTLVLGLTVSCGTHQLTAFGSLNRAALTRAPAQPKMQKILENPRKSSPATTPATRVVERHQKVRYMLHMLPERYAALPVFLIRSTP